MYVPAGCDGEDCDVPEPVIVAGPVIVQEEDTFEETFTVPRTGSTQETVTNPDAPAPPPYVYVQALLQ